MEEENSEKMDVSYGVEKPNDSADLKPKKKAPKKKKKTKKVYGKEETPKKKTLIDEINEMKAAGEVNTPEFKEKMGKLESVLGVDTISPFGTNELDIFEDNLKEMNYADKRQMAHKIGISPFQSEPMLNSSLLREFKARNKNNMRNIMPEASSVMELDPNNPQHKKTIDILGEI